MGGGGVKLNQQYRNLNSSKLLPLANAKGKCRLTVFHLPTITKKLLTFNNS